MTVKINTPLKSGLPMFVTIRSLVYKIFQQFIIILAAVLPVQVMAQQYNVEVGNRVKLHVPTMSNDTFEGDISSLSDSSMVLEVGSYTYIIPVESIEKIAVSTGKEKQTKKGLLIGIIGGATLGSIIGYSYYQPCNDEGWFSCIGKPGSSKDAAMLGGFLGTIIGGSIGMLTGSAIETERWKQVPNDILFNMEQVGSLQPEMYPQLTIRWRIGSRK